MDKNLKVYIWDEFNTDYTCGLAVAIAYSIEEAQQLVREEYGYEPSWGSEPTIRELEPQAHSVSGGS